MPILSVTVLVIFVLSILFTIEILAKPTGLYLASTTLIKIDCCCAIEISVKLKNNKRKESLNIEGIEN
jgi:hypothetical protein